MEKKILFWGGIIVGGYVLLKVYYWYQDPDLQKTISLTDYITRLG